MPLLQLISLLISTSIAQAGDKFSEPGWESITIQISDRSEHRIQIPWLIQNTLSVNIDTVLLQENDEYFWVDSTRTLIIKSAEPWMAGRSILINYRSAAITDSLTYQLYTLSLLQDSLNESSPNAYVRSSGVKSPNISPFDDWGGIYRSGSISRGLRISGSEATLSSGLHLEMHGSLPRGASVNVLIDDRDISATQSGGSSTFSELEKIYFTYSSPALKAELGDIDVSWDTGKFGHFSRQIKGGALSARHKESEFSLIAAGSDNIYHRINIVGRSGDQGPYELLSKDGLPGIQVNSGSERVHLNGRLLKRGFERDYLIDYARGTITFTPIIQINSDSRIEMEYQYTAANYAGYLFAGRVSSSSVLSNSLSIEYSGVVEGDDNDRPLSYEWTNEMKGSVSEAGDRQSLAYIFGIDSVGEGKGDYYYDFEGTDRNLIFSLPDSLGHPTGYLAVIFSKDDSGEYIRQYNAQIQTFYFEWAGVGASNNMWSPNRAIPLPERLVHNDLVLSRSRGPFSTHAEIAVSNHDLNTLSPLDEKDNLGVAWRWMGSWGDFNIQPFSTSISIQNRENNYQSLDRSVDPDFDYHWNLPDSAESGERSIETTVRFKPSDKFSTSGEAGYLQRGSIFKVRRIGIASNYIWHKWDISGSHNRTRRSNIKDSFESQLLHWNSRLSRKFAGTFTSYDFKRAATEDTDANEYRNVVQRDNHSLSVKQRLNSLNEINLSAEYYNEDRTANNQLSNWSDARSIAGSWRRDRDADGGWSVDLRRSFTTYSKLPATYATNARVDAVRTFSRFPLTLQADYFLTTGNDRISTTVASFVGDNQGGYRREGDRYVPDPHGEFDLREVLTDTIAAVSRIDFNGRISFGESSRGFGNEPLPDYWLGFKGSTIRIDAELMTSANDSWETFFLTRSAFNDSEVISSRLLILQDYDFTSDNRKVDSRISLSWENDLDRIRYGGERNGTESISFRQRAMLIPAFRMKILPKLSHSSREKLIGNEKKTDIYTTGSEVEGVIQPLDSPLEVGLSFGYTAAEDRISEQSAIIREWKPWVNFRFTNSGALRVDGSLIVLSKSDSRAWYDLDRGWRAGNNYKFNLSYISQISDNVSLNFYYRGLWIGDNFPRHEGLLEFTATL